MRRRPHWAIAAVALLVGYWAVLFAGTHYPKPPGTFAGNEDKLIHLAAFTGLAILILAALRLRGPITTRHFLATVLLLSAYGAVDEQSQKWVGRTCSLGDWLADLTGAVLGACLFLCLDKALRRRRRLITPRRVRSVDPKLAEMAVD